MEWNIAQSVACPPLNRSVVGSILLSGHICSMSYFPFQPVLHNWLTKGRGMYCSVHGKVHIKDPLLLMEKGSGFPLFNINICPGQTAQEAELCADDSVLEP